MHSCTSTIALAVSTAYRNLVARSLDGRSDVGAIEIEAGYWIKVATAKDESFLDWCDGELPDELLQV